MSFLKQIFRTRFLKHKRYVVEQSSINKFFKTHTYLLKSGAMKKEGVVEGHDSSDSGKDGATRRVLLSFSC